jgi:hypothetical protein
VPLISSNVAGRRRRWLWTAVAASFLLAIAATGPFADRQFLRSSFQHGQDLMRFDRPAGRIDLGLVPSFYRSDALAAPGASIVEFPFRGGWSATRAHAVYQGTHHARVLAAEPYRWLCNSRLRLRNHVCYRPDSILASDARFLVIHRDPLREEHRIVGGDDSGNAYDPAEWNRVRRISRHLTRQLRREWGAPFDEDDRIVVWDLAAVRSERRTRIGGG